MKKLLLPSIALLLAISAPAQTLADKNGLPLAMAKKMAEAAEKFALRNKWNVVITILDEGGTNLLKLGVMPYEGGLPVIVSGEMIVAAGVSGATAAQDGQVAKAATDWLAAALK